MCRECGETAKCGGIKVFLTIVLDGGVAIGGAGWKRFGWGWEIVRKSWSVWRNTSQNGLPQSHLAGHISGPSFNFEEQFDEILLERGGCFMRLMLEAATNAERRGLLDEWQAGMPAEVFAGVINGVVGGEWAEGDLAAFDRV